MLVVILGEEKGENWAQPLLRPVVFQNIRENRVFNPEEVIKRLEYSPEMEKGAYNPQLGLW